MHAVFTYSTPYFRARAMQRCHVNFSPEDLCCHGNQPFLSKDKIGCRLTRASNAETQLLSYIAWQCDRYLVPQNVLLVFTDDFHSKSVVSYPWGPGPTRPSQYFPHIKNIFCIKHFVFVIFYHTVCFI